MERITNEEILKIIGKIDNEAVKAKMKKKYLFKKPKKQSNKQLMEEILTENKFPETDLTRKRVLFFETNLMKLPFCKFTKNKSASGIEFKGIDKSGRPFQWSVLPSVKYGDPRAYEQDVIFGVFSLCSKRMLENKGEIPKIIYFRTEELIEEMGKNPVGDTIRRTEEALKRIRATHIMTENTFKIKERKYTINGEMEFLKVVFIARDSIVTGSTGEKEKLNRMELGDTVMENMKEKYRYRLNPDYIRELKNPLAKKLYAFLTYNFVSSKGMNLQFNYKTLCDQIPLERKKEYWNVKRQFEPALKELKKTKFIKSYKWEEIKKFGKKEWKLTIKPGERFNIEFRQNSKIKMLKEK